MYKVTSDTNLRLGEVMTGRTSASAVAHPSDAGSPSNEEIRAQQPAEEFFPKGAIAFFVSMIVGFGLIWAGLFALMVHRQFHP